MLCPRTQHLVRPIVRTVVLVDALRAEAAVPNVPAAPARAVDAQEVGVAGPSGAVVRSGADQSVTAITAAVMVNATTPGTAAGESAARITAASVLTAGVNVLTGAANVLTPAVSVASPSNAARSCPMVWT